MVIFRPKRKTHLFAEMGVTRKIFTRAAALCIVWREKTRQPVWINLLVENCLNSKFYWLNVCHYGFRHKGEGNCLKYLKRGWNKKEGGETKILTRGLQAGSRGKCLKNRGGTPLRTMLLKNRNIVPVPALRRSL